MALPLDGYIRVSRVGKRDQNKGGEGFISPDVQRDAIRAWADTRGAEILVHEPELNRSGGTMDRPVFNSIMERVRSGRSGGLVVYKLDRFARNLHGAISTLAEIGEHNGTFVSVSEPGLDYSTPNGRAYLHMMFVIAQLMRENITEEWATAQRHAIERGVHISPSTYLGYDRGDDGRLVPNDDAPVVREAFVRRGETQSWGQIATWLNKVAPRADEGNWTAQGVQRMCSHRVYRGEASRNVKRDKAGRGPIVNPDAHPPIVTEDEWRAAQMTTPPVGGRRAGDPGPLLAGLIRCSGCRHQLSQGKSAKGERTYRCRPAKASGKCGRPAMVMADALDAYVEAAVLSEIDGLVRLVPDSSDRDRVVAALEQERANLDAFRRNRDGLRQLGAETWNEWLAGYLTAIRRLEAELSAIDARHGVARDGLTRDHYLSLPLDDRREVLAGFIDTVMVRPSRGRGRNVDPIDQRSRILWRGEAPHDLPRPRVSSPIVPFVFDDEQHVEAGIVAAQHPA